MFIIVYCCEGLLYYSRRRMKKLMKQLHVLLGSTLSLFDPSPSKGLHGNIATPYQFACTEIYAALFALPHPYIMTDP